MSNKEFRRWWQRPRRASERIHDRKVSFLELFYDLVYVALIAQLSHDLSENLTEPEGIFGFIGLYLLVWWAWVNGTFYHDLHGNNDIKTRVLTFVQMVALIVMAIFSHDVFGENFGGFSITYGFFLLILSFLWWRTGVHDPDHRPLSNPYSISFVISSILFISAAFVEREIALILWLVALFLTTIFPIINIFISRKNEATDAYLEESFKVSASLVERIGLLTIIVLGEVVVAIVSASGGQELEIELGFKILCSILLAIGIWWLYFDMVSDRHPRAGMWSFSSWLYSHLPITLSIIFIGAAVKHILLNDVQHIQEVKAVLLSSFALLLAFISLVVHSLEKSERFQKITRKTQPLIWLSVVLLLGMIFVPLSNLMLLGGVVLFLFLPILVGLFIWIRI
ncbi:MAG: low temperature requirement protein A [Bacteroidia bacterium]|nr:low temperature requirement protein A [Bacteroidia bacterium]